MVSTFHTIFLFLSFPRFFVAAFSQIFWKPIIRETRTTNSLHHGKFGTSVSTWWCGICRFLQASLFCKFCLFLQITLKVSGSTASQIYFSQAKDRLPFFSSSYWVIPRNISMASAQSLESDKFSNVSKDFSFCNILIWFLLFCWAVTCFRYNLTSSFKF